MHSSPVSSRSDPRRFLVGLTGGIGSGKSLVADELARLGAQIIDTDAIAHRLTAAGGPAIDAIRSAFGRKFVTVDGALDRARMRELVFSDAQARARLEAILHPAIRARAESLANETAADSAYTIFVVPLLIESGAWRARVDRVLVVDCGTGTQVARVMRRNHLNARAAGAIIAAQTTRAARLDAADDIIVNEGPRAAVAQRAARLHDAYCRLAQAKRFAAGSDGSL
jgi:dephospho-CoA kinase